MAAAATNGSDVFCCVSAPSILLWSLRRLARVWATVDSVGGGSTYSSTSNSRVNRLLRSISARIKRGSACRLASAPRGRGDVKLMIQCWRRRCRCSCLSFGERRVWRQRRAYNRRRRSICHSLWAMNEPPRSANATLVAKRVKVEGAKRKRPVQIPGKTN